MCAARIIVDKYLVLNEAAVHDHAPGPEPAEQA
jgi:hypothetical protein